MLLNEISVVLASGSAPYQKTLASKLASLGMLRRAISLEPDLEIKDCDEHLPAAAPPVPGQPAVHRGELLEMGKAARAKIESQFTLEHYNQRVIAFYRSLLSRHEDARIRLSEMNDESSELSDSRSRQHVHK